MSLCASGTPCSGPLTLPFASAASAASAAASACSASIAMKALRRGCHCLILSRQDCVASREETRFSAMACATDVSDSNAGSVLIWWTFISQPSWCLGGLHQKKRRGLQIERQRAGDRRKAFKRRTDRIGNARGHLGAHGHARDVSYRLDLFRRRSCHVAFAPFAGARLWPEPGMAI